MDLTAIYGTLRRTIMNTRPWYANLKNVRLSPLSHGVQIEWISENAFVFSTCSTKISVLLFYHRLDSTAYTRTVKRTIYGSIALTIAYWLGSLLYLSLLCHPTAGYWRLLNLSHPKQHSCVSQRMSYPIGGSISILSTVYTILLPYFVLRNLPMSKNYRHGLNTVFVLSSG